ncbi:MAG: autotransporter domain-containing protein [Betaproteobacteria bacterium]|nr:autotransporter domain-containing protein [Betaproteobacteria bacterium]
MRKTFDEHASDLPGGTAQIAKLFGATAIATVLSLISTSAEAQETIVYSGDTSQLGNPSTVWPNPPYTPSVPNSLFPRNFLSSNSVTVNSGAIGGHVFGGIAAYSDQNADDNAVIINGGTIGTSTGGNVFGGWSLDSSASGNSVEVNDATVRGIVFGGWRNGGTSSSDVSDNTVTINSGAEMRGNIYGGYSQGQNGNISGNKIVINDRAVRGTASSPSIIAGAYSALLLNNVFDNSVTIDGGTISYASIYGGRGQVNSPITKNTVTIGSGTISNSTIYGGQNINNGAVSENSVVILGGSVGATIYGGHSSGGSAVTGNTVSISGGSVTGDIYGGYSNRGSATGNIVTVDGAASLTNANLFGGFVNSGSGDAFTGNTLNKNSAATVNTARNFAVVNFGYTGDASIGTLYTTPTGSSLSGITLNTGALDVNFGGVITGTGNLTKTGTGTLILTNTNNYSGGTIVSDGILQIGNGGATGSITGNILNNANVTFNHSNYVYSGIISGIGSLTKIGAGTLILTGANNYSGGTIVFDGILQIGNGGATGSITGDIVNNAHVAFNRSNNVYYDGQITGTGKIVQGGSGALALTGGDNNKFNGGTEIESGTLLITDSYSYNQADDVDSSAGYLTFTGATGQKNIVLQNYDPIGILLTNSFRTQSGAGHDNNVDLRSSSPVAVTGIGIGGDGGVFYVAADTTMNVTANTLLLMDNKANNGNLNDLYVESGGVFNLTVHEAEGEVPAGVDFMSGIGGEGTLNISTKGLAAVLFQSDSGGVFAMGTTNVKGDEENIAILSLLRLDSSKARLTFTNTGTFSVTGDTNPISAVLMGDGIVKATVINITDGAALAPTDKSKAGTLTLEADTVNLNDFALLYTAFGAQEPLDTTHPDSIPISNNDLLYINSNNATLTNGVVYFKTVTGNSFGEGDYLVIRSTNGFSNIGSDNDLKNQLHTIMVDGFELKPNEDGPRGGDYGLKLGGDPNVSGGWQTGSTNVWFAHSLNSLTMAWTGTGTEAAPVNGSWESGELFYSLQDSVGEHERRFLTGDKVYISGGNPFTINLHGSDSLTGQKIVVSGLVIGRNMDGYDTDGGVYTISGDGGITADKDSAFGTILQDSGVDDNVLKTGKLQKYGDNTLKFTNTGGNLFREGIELHGGVVEFTQAEQLDDGGEGIKFAGDSALKALENVMLDNVIEIDDGFIGSLGADANVVFTYTGNLIGTDSSTLDKSGAGTVRLDATSGFAGMITVSEGTLEVVGNYGNTAQFNVKDGGTLSGTGIIGTTSGGTIESGGTLKPGGLDDNAFLTIIGDLTFAAGSNFDIRLEFGVENNDKVILESGTASIGSQTANLNAKVDFWKNTGSFNGPYTIIDASDGTVGNTSDEFILKAFGLPRGWNPVNGWNDDLFQLEFRYDPNNGFGAIGFTHNQTAIGKTIDWFVANRDPGIRHLIDRVSDPDWSNREVAKQLDQLHGDLTPNAFFLALKEPWRHPFNRLLPGSYYSQSYDGIRSEARAWAEFINRYEDLDHDGNAHGSTIHRNGIAVGVDYPLSPHSVVGMTLQYTHPRLNQKTGTVKADDYEFGLYGMARLMDDLDLKAYLGYSYQRYDFRRAVSLPATRSGSHEAFYERLNGSASGNALSASVELIRSFQAQANIRLLPVVALDFEKARINGYRESVGEASLIFDAASMKRTMLRLGLDSAFDFQNGFYLKPKIQYAIQVDGQKHPSVNARFANATLPNQRKADIWGSEIGRNYWNFGLGGGWKLDSRGDKELYVNYDAKLYKRATSHTGMLGFTMKW